MSQLEITELVDVVRTVDSAGVVPVVAALTARLEAMVMIGLGYLTLSRATTTLSGGESQRIKTGKQLGSSLTEMTYVVDEPTVGLHPTDVESMIALLERLRDSGDSVLVVEHDPAVMAHADQIIEVGPGPATPTSTALTSTRRAGPPLAFVRRIGRDPGESVGVWAARGVDGWGMTVCHPKRTCVWTGP